MHHGVTINMIIFVSLSSRVIVVAVPLTYIILVEGQDVFRYGCKGPMAISSYG